MEEEVTVNLKVDSPIKKVNCLSKSKIKNFKYYRVILVILILSLSCTYSLISYFSQENDNELLTQINQNLRDVFIDMLLKGNSPRLGFLQAHNNKSSRISISVPESAPIPWLGYLHEPNKNISRISIRVTESAHIPWLGYLQEPNTTRSRIPLRVPEPSDNHTLGYYHMPNNHTNITTLVAEPAN